MRRHTLLALSLAAGLALPVGFSTTALAITDAQRTTLGAASASNQATMQAAIATVLQELLAEDRPLEVALDELAGVLLDLGVTDELKAEFAVALVMAAQDLGAAGSLSGYNAVAAGDAAAEAVLVRAQGSPALVSAIVAEASAKAAGDMPGGQGSTVLAAFVAASTSPLIDMANRNAVRSTVVAASVTAPVGGVTGTQFGNGGAGGGPNLGGMTLVQASTGGGAGRGGSSQQSSAGQVMSPN